MEVLKDVSSGLVPFLATPKAVVAVDAAYPNRKIGLFFHSLRHIYYLSAVILPTFGNSNRRIENTYVYEESSHIFNLFNRLSDRLPCANGGRALLFQKS